MNKPFSAWALSLSVASCLIAPCAANANESILRKAGCFVCHSVASKRIGPAYKDVAARYSADENAPAILFDKVRRGGSGRWGDVPMTAHPIDTIGDDDLKTAIHWILSRKS